MSRAMTTAMLIATATVAAGGQPRQPFHVEEATIVQIQQAIQSHKRLSRSS